MNKLALGILIAIFMLFATTGYTSSDLLGKFVENIANNLQKQSSIKMAHIKSDGKRGSEKVIDYSVYKTNGIWQAHWNEVIFQAMDDGVMPLINHYSTNDGNIKNIIVSKDTVSFDIIDGIAIAHIVCKPPKEYPYTPEIIEIVKTDTGKEEWVVVDRIVLKSNEIYGIPARGENLIKKK